MKPNKLPTQRQLKELFDYSVTTGLLYEKTKRRGTATNAGEEVASKLSNVGYKRIRIDGQLFQQHRVIWKWMTGEEPRKQIDHKDEDKTNNAWHNLRAAKHINNNTNRGKYKNNTSGFKGVSYYKRDDTWEARIAKGGKTYRLGRYKTPEEASETYEKVAYILNGTFYRPSN